MDVLLTIFWGVVVLAILVVVHEAGHFIFARAFGVRVTEFMVGMPGPNVGVNVMGTKFGVTCIPLGGYNRICGMEGGPEDENLGTVLAYVYRQGTADVEHTALACGISEDDAEFALVVLDGWGSINKPGRDNKLGKYAAPKTAEHELGEPREVEDPDALLDAERAQTYRALPVWKRLVVLFAGPVFNILLAVVLLLVAFCGIGTTVASTTIADVVDGGPAAAAGIQAGDRIVAVGGAETPDWSALHESVAALEVGQEVEVSYERDGQERSTRLEISANGEGAPQLGIYAGTEQYHMPVGEALGASWDYLVMTVQAYAKLFNPVTTAETVSQSTSIVGISVVAKESAAQGLMPLLFIMAVISLSLGIVNLVPLPPLDGGKIVVEVIQKVVGRDIPVRVINGISIAVIVLFMLLFVVLLQQDIRNFVFGEIWQ